MLLGDRPAGAAELFGDVLELGKTIFDAQDGRLVVIERDGKVYVRD